MTPIYFYEMPRRSCVRLSIRLFRVWCCQNWAPRSAHCSKSSWQATWYLAPKCWAFVSSCLVCWCGCIAGNPLGKHATFGTYVLHACHSSLGSLMSTVCRLQTNITTSISAYKLQVVYARCIVACADLWFCGIAFLMLRCTPAAEYWLGKQRAEL